MGTPYDPEKLAEIEKKHELTPEDWALIRLSYENCPDGQPHQYKTATDRASYYGDHQLKCIRCERRMSVDSTD